MKSLHKLNIGVIGAGNMGQALIAGLRDAGLAPSQLLVVEARESLHRALRRRYAVRMTTLDDLAARCDIIILAVKPQDLWPIVARVGRLIRQRTSSSPLVVSIAAGVTTASLERLLGSVPVVRVMPNLAAKVRAAISAIAAGRRTTTMQRRRAAAIFRCVGDVVEVPEHLFDIVTALSGSGPAYFFLIFQALRDAGVTGGLSRALAQRLAIRTAVGSACLVDGLGEELDTLMAQVASKRGTTEAALRVFRKRHLSRILQDGVLAARRRSRELTALLQHSAKR